MQMTTDELIKDLREYAELDEMPLRFVREILIEAADRLEELQSDDPTLPFDRFAHPDMDVLAKRDAFIEDVSIKIVGDEIQNQ